MRQFSRENVVLFTLSLSLLLAGCNAGTDTPSAKETAAAPLSSSASDAPQETNALPAQTTTPSIPTVLQRITDVDGGGASSYAINNGSTIHYWTGVEFEADGKRHFTGFAWVTPEKYGAARENGQVDPSAKVTLTHATFVASAPGDETPWTWEGSELWSGEFGQAEQANAADHSRTAQTWTTPSGRVVLAQPSLVTSAQGTTPAFEVLVFNPHELKDDKDRKWLHLGTIAAGNGQAPATLELLPTQGEDLPTLRVNAAGGAPTDYRFDQTKRQYTPASG